MFEHLTPIHWKSEAQWIDPERCILCLSANMHVLPNSPTIITAIEKTSPRTGLVFSFGFVEKICLSRFKVIGKHARRSAHPPTDCRLGCAQIIRNFLLIHPLKIVQQENLPIFLRQIHNHQRHMLAIRINMKYLCWQFFHLDAVVLKTHPSFSQIILTGVAGNPQQPCSFI